VSIFGTITPAELQAERTRLEALITPADRAAAAKFESGFLGTSTAGRDIGSAIPSGVNNIAGSIANSDILNQIPGGSIIKSIASAFVTTGQKEEAGATVEPTAGEAPPTVPEITKTATQGGKNVRQFPNSLEQFASYTPLWTMSALTPEQFNNPISYRNSPADLKHIVFSSAGRYDSQRVGTAYGTPEYYVNNLTMATVIAATQKTGNSNAIKFNFDVYEPYSMGLFLQSLQLAALNAKHPNYLQAPFVLKLDFLGLTDDGKLFQGVNPKYFTIKLTKVTFNTSESGSSYKVDAVPFNHQAFGSTVNKAFNDIAIMGPADKKTVTVKDLLVEGENSLCAVLNRAEKELTQARRSKQNYPDEYEIQFPISSDQFFNTVTPASGNGATVVPGAAQPTSVGNASATPKQYGDNSIGLSDMGITTSSGGNYSFKREGDVIDSATGKVQRNQMTIDPKNRKFQFTQEQSLTNIISQVILSSKYATDAIQQKPSTEGFISWFKIDAQIQLKEFDDKRGDFAKKIIYRVLPYKVHISIFSNPTSAVGGYAELEKLIAKRYDYIYSGQNNDVLKFDIQIDNLFYSGSNPKSEETNGANSNLDQKGPAEAPPNTTVTNQGASGGAAIGATTGSSPTKRDPALMNLSPSPKGGETTEELVARTFHHAFLNNSGGLINVELEILGDPYWMVDSGISNYFSPASGDNPLTTEDGTMNYEGSDVYIYLTFRTPTDINEQSGLYNFPDGGSESPFSGIYKVTRCENNFSDGTFKQKLKTIRMPKQPSDFDGQSQQVDPATTAQQSIGPPVPPKTGLTDDELAYAASLGGFSV
jgi:hypothetical protein